VLAARDDTPDAIRRNFAIELVADDRVSRVVEKPAEVRTSVKGTGLYLFDPSILDATRQTPVGVRGELEITDAIQTLIDWGQPVSAARVVRDDHNLNGPDDLLRCNLAYLRASARERICGAGTHVHRDARIERSVLGARVRVEAPVHIVDSLILDDTVVRETSRLDRVIHAPGAIVRCFVDASSSVGDSTFESARAYPRLPRPRALA
jgi:dTDP-glucose pyrophosphorylase